MNEIVVAASRNRHKNEEIEAITKKFGMEIQSRDDAGVPKIEIEEDGETFEENSRKKAEAVMKLCGKVTIADDSGLMVEYLGGAPGVYSARFAGEDCSDEKKQRKASFSLGRRAVQGTQGKIRFGDHHALARWRPDRCPRRM